jgi:hypothetical protein
MQLILSTSTQKFVARFKLDQNNASMADEHADRGGAGVTLVKMK